MSDVFHMHSVATWRRCKKNCVKKDITEAGCVREYFYSRRLDENSMTETSEAVARSLFTNKLKDKAVTN
jgi:hypothetical protein